jgi:hypothetical protein
MIVQAQTRSTPFPLNHFQGSIHSIFPHTVNIEIEDAENILTLYNTPIDYPGGLRVNLNDLEKKSMLAVGQGVVNDRGMLRFENSNIALEYYHAKVINCKMPILTVERSIHALEALDLIYELLRKKAHVLFVDMSVYQRKLNRSLTERLKVLSDGIQANGQSIDKKVVSQLIGLGSGLTPSGDDILLGLLAGFSLNQGSGLIQKSSLDQIKKEIQFHLKQTNIISQNYLRYATQGYFSSGIIDLLMGFSQSKNKAYLKDCVLNILKTGHTSGYDIMVGLFLSLCAVYQVEVNDFKIEDFYPN